MRRYCYSPMIILVILLSLIVSSTAFAQKADTPWYISFDSGVSIVNFNEAGKTTPTFRLFGGYDLTPGFGFRTGLYTGRFKSGTKKNYFNRSYNTSYVGFTLEPRFNFLSMFKAAPANKYVDIYGFGGPGLFWYSAKDSMKSVSQTTEPYKGISNKSIALVYSLGMGVNVNITSRFSIKAEYSYHMSNSELIDGYPTVGNNSSNPYKPHEYRNDSWTYLTLGFSIRLGREGTTGTSLSNDASVDEYGYGDQLRQMNQLIDQNLATIRKSNEELTQATQVLNEFQKLATEMRLQRQQQRISRLQTQLDSLGTMKAQLDSLKMMQARIELIRNSLNNQKEADKSPTARRNTSYYVIAGEFLSQSKADNMLSQLQSSDYPNATVIRDVHNVWYLVTYAGAQNNSQAQSLLQKVKSYDNPLAWIYTKK